jgi:hypothetical protein
MTTLKADANGVLRGSFKVPAAQPAGTYDVSVKGAFGSEAQTAFTGQGTAKNTEIQTLISSTLTTYQRYDPLAQTFTFDRDTYLAAVDIWVKIKGNTPLSVDIRVCENGIPTPEILRKVRVEVADVVNVDNNQQTRIAFDPVRLERGVEYCFVVMADDPHWTVEVATLGEFDPRANKWMTSQAFQIGTLLSSSNASTWTPHQKTDMRFRLFEAVFDTNVRSYSLGAFDLYNADLVHCQFNAERVDEETDVALVMTMPDGKTEYRLKEDTISSFSEKVTGKAQVKLELRGTPSKTPIALSGVTLVSSGVIETGQYITKHINLGDDVDVRVTYELATGNTSSVLAYYAIGEEWKELPLEVQLNLDDGFRERRYKIDGISGDTLRIKLVLEGTALDAPRVRKLRVVTI